VLPRVDARGVRPAADRERRVFRVSRIRRPPPAPETDLRSRRRHRFRAGWRTAATLDRPGRAGRALAEVPDHRSQLHVPLTPRQCRPPLGVPPRLDAVSRLDSQWVVAAGARPDRLQRRRRGAVSGPVVECRSLEGELLAGILKRPYSAIVPCRYSRASPTIFTRSPVTLHCIEPPRALSCCARNVCFPSRPAQYGASVQCIEPVAGSSAMPMAGAKNLHT